MSYINILRAACSTPPPLPSFTSDAVMSYTASREPSVGVDDRSETSSEDESSIGILVCFETIYTCKLRYFLQKPMKYGKVM